MTRTYFEGWSRFTKRLAERSRSQLPVPACMRRVGGGNEGAEMTKKGAEMTFRDDCGGVNLPEPVEMPPGRHPSRQGEEPR